MVRTCTICTKDHDTEHCPSLPELNAIFKEVEEETEPLLTQPNLNPNNRLVQLVQIIENPKYEIEQKECNELRLRSGRVINLEENRDQPSIENVTPPIHIPPPVNNTKPKQGEETDHHDDPEKFIVTSPLSPGRLTIPKPITYPNFDLVGELKNLCIKIPLLHAIQDIPIYAKTIKELCVRKPVRKVKTSPTIHVVGTLSDLLLGEETPMKYKDPRNPIVTVQIYGCSFPNTLVDLGAAINILTTKTCQALGIAALEPTTTSLELADRSVVRLEGTLHDIIVSVDSWDYPVDFLVINPRSRFDGHPLILG
eukprot:PITA_02518